MGAQVAQFAGQQQGFAAMLPMALTSLDAAGAGVVDESQLQAYMDRWALGEDARSIFLALSPENRLRVMTEFSPRDLSSDVNNVFMKFCQGVGSGKGKGKGKGPPGSSGADGRLPFAPY